MIKLQKGDTVRLAQIVTQAEFGLALCDDNGAGLEIDGVVIEAVLGVIKGVVIAAIHLPTKHSQVNSMLLLFQYSSNRQRFFCQLTSLI